MQAKKVDIAQKFKNGAQTWISNTAGGIDFPQIKLYKLELWGIPEEENWVWGVFNTFTFNNYDMNCKEGMLLNFTEEKITSDRALQNGDLKEYYEGHRIYCEVPFHALLQLGTGMNPFLIDYHKAQRITVKPHKDKPEEYEVLRENSWDYTYWENKAWLGWKGTLKMRGVKLYTEFPMK